MRKVTLLLGLLLSGYLGAAAAGGGIAVAAEAESGTAPVGIEIDSSVFGALRVRAIGPAVMGGRVAALDAVASDPRILFVGAASGGVWRSKNGGVSFSPVFDDHCQAIGALRIDQAHPDTIWVGTGEPWVRNSVSVGDGVYKSTDGGDNWRKVGLEDSERIGRIAIDSVDPDVVYVAALGHLWNANEERGLYKTSDGGETWDRVLYVDENTGCCDVVLDPQQPNIVYAAMWEFRRSADFFNSGGPGSGLYKSVDGGASWRKLARGLPEGELGRIALDVSPARPSRLYALVEAEDSGFYRSDDMGENWQRVNDSRSIKGRPFYFGLVVCDPQDYERVYKPGFTISVSRDGGETFDGVGGWVHVDYHAMWINPKDPKHIYVGNDGGVYVSHNRGNGWWYCNSLPVSQFYRISVDQERPYNIYGGLQDNGSWRGPSASPGGIENSDWENLGGGDGFCTLADPLDPDIIYWEYQGGNVMRLHLSSSDTKDIRPAPAAGEPDYRFNWNTPIYISPSDPSRLYVGSQFLHRSTDRGDTWQRLGDDLTTDDPDKQRQKESGGLTVDNTTAENHCTIFSIAESPLDQTVIWVGTDDGNLQLSTDDGASWRELSGGIEGLPPATWVSYVEASRHDRATAFVTFDGHRSGDMQTYVYMTDDLGETWRSVATEDISGYAHVLRQDPVNPDLLFLGTESGLFITVDGGLNWAHYQERMPPVPVKDMVIQTREDDLVIGTHGRGIWVMDSIQPLRQITAEALAQDVYLFTSPPAFASSRRGKQHSPGDSYFAAGNPSETAQIIYYLKKRHMFGDMRLEIFDPDGELIKELPGGKRKGINRVTWRMRLKPPKTSRSRTLDPRTAFAGSVGPMAPEGVYTYVLTKGKESYSGTIEVVANPESPHSAADRALQQQTVMDIYNLLERLGYVTTVASETRDQALERAEQLEEKDKLHKKLDAFAEELQELYDDLLVDEEVQGISGQRRTREKLALLYASVSWYGGRPGAAQVAQIPVFSAQIDEAEADLQAILDAQVEDLDKDLVKKDLEPLQILDREEYDKRAN